MSVQQTFFAIYLVIGFIYAVGILVRGNDKWYLFPINMLFGPLGILYIIYLAAKEELPGYVKNV